MVYKTTRILNDATNCSVAWPWFWSMRPDELFIEGDKLDSNREFKGLSGKGLGIQLELDKQKDERYYPSQLFYNLANNMKIIPQLKIIA